MKTKFCFYSQPNYPHPRTAIEAEILFAARIKHLRFLERLSGKTPPEQNSSGEKIGAESAVLHFVFFEVIVNKMQQSAKAGRSRSNKNILFEVFPLTAILAGSGKTVPFEKRRSRYKETAENKAEAYRVYVEHLFSACDAVDARIFSKGDGETITYTYDKGGQLKGVSGVKNTVKGTENYRYIDTIVYDEHGQRVYIKYGNGVETKYRYDDKRRWLKDIETKNKQTDEIFQKISYSFDKVGNVLGYSNDASVYETSQSYTYDNLYQLIGVEGTSNQYKAIKSFGSTPVNVAKYKQDFAFDGIGNMTRKVSTTNLPGARGNAYPKAELDYSLDYEYDPACAHRLVHAGNRYYRYDANGNITAEKDGPFTEDDEFIFTYNYDPDTDVYGTDYGFGLDAPKETEETHPENLFAYRRNYTWNEKNLLTKSSDRSYTVHYRYGEDGQRALKYTEEGRSETLYFNNFYTVHIPVQDKNNPQGLRVHKHIFVGNSRLVTAMTHTDNNGDNAEQREKRYYYHSDHLGSAQFVTDWRGKQYEHIEYTPYGELWIEEVAAGLDKLSFRFTGKEMDEETGLYYYGARYLDPKYSRWLSGDPALGAYVPAAGSDPSELAGMGGVFNVVNLHLYHYAGNNPVKYIDPDGKESGYILDNEGAQGFGHAGMYVQTKDGKYAFFEVTGISEEANGIESNISPGSTVKDKWGHDTTVLSNLPLKFPTQGSAQSMGQPTRAGCLLRTFDKREDMIAALQKMDFDEMIVFNTHGREDTEIYNKAFVEGQSFSGYQVFNDSCGIFARNALTVQGSGIKAINPFVNINHIFSSSIPNEIGVNLYLANPESTVIRWRQK